MKKKKKRDKQKQGSRERKENSDGSGQLSSTNLLPQTDYFPQYAKTIFIYLHFLNPSMFPNPLSISAILQTH